MFNRNYKLAISLAESVKGAFDLDIIYKRQWEDLKKEHTMDETSLEVLVYAHLKILELKLLSVPSMIRRGLLKNVCA